MQKTTPSIIRSAMTGSIATPRIKKVFSFHVRRWHLKKEKPLTSLFGKNYRIAAQGYLRSHHSTDHGEVGNHLVRQIVDFMNSAGMAPDKDILH